MRALPVTLVCALLLTVGVAGCFGGDGDGKPTTTTKRPTTTRPTTTEPTTTAPTTSASPSPTTAVPTTSASPSPSPSTSPAPTTSPTPPPDTTPPEVTGIQVTGIQANQVTIQWTVSDLSEPVFSQIQYDTTGDPYDFQTSLIQGTGDLSHTLTGLRSNTKYFFHVLARDSAQNVGSGPNLDFTTLNVPPVVTEVTVSNVRNDRFTVTWTQAGGDETLSYVKWGTSNQYGLGQSPNQAGTGTKSFTVTGLGENQLYHFRIFASSGSGNAQSATDMTQKTANLVEISLTSTPCPLRFTPSSVSSTAADLLLVRVTYNAGSQGGIHSWELRNGGTVVTGFASPDLTASGQVWEAMGTLAAGNYGMWDRSDSGSGVACGTWNVS